jgi:hypothetical protein
MEIDPYNGEQVADVLSKFVNRYGTDEIDKLIEAMFRDHRTLVQKKMGIAFKMIYRAAQLYKEKCFDGRNEYSFKLANDTVEKTVEKDFEGDYHRFKLGMPLV